MSPSDTIIITGAGRGLGRALALELAGPGRRLGLLARTAAELEETAAEVRARGAFVHTIQADVGRLERAPRLALELVDRLGPIDVLIHNASVLGPVPLALLADTAVKDFVQAFEVNVLGPFALTRALLGSMLLVAIRRRTAGTEAMAPAILGFSLIVVVYVLPDGIVGGYRRALAWLHARRAPDPPPDGAAPDPLTPAGPTTT